jgi:hypothetical protein
MKQMFDRVGSDPAKKSVSDAEMAAAKEFSQLEMKIDRLSQSVDVIHGENKKILEKLDDMFDAMYNPDQGLYARIKDQEGRINVLEGFKNSTNKMLWLISSTLIGGMVKLMLDFFTAS